MTLHTQLRRALRVSANDMHGIPVPTHRCSMTMAIRDTVKPQRHALLPIWAWHTFPSAPN